MFFQDHQENCKLSAKILISFQFFQSSSNEFYSKNIDDLIFVWKNFLLGSFKILILINKSSLVDHYLDCVLFGSTKLANKLVNWFHCIWCLTLLLAGSKIYVKWRGGGFCFSDRSLEIGKVKKFGGVWRPF